MPRLIVVAAAMLAIVATKSDAKDYKLTGDNTKIEFVGTKPDGKHTGSFPKLSGSLQVNDDITKGKIALTIDVESLESDDAKLTGHLKSPDFFETKKFPDAKFVSKTITSDKAGYKITGDLTMHGKTKEISFPAKIERTDSGYNLSSEFKINRSDWGISYGAGKIDEAVSLTVKIQNAK